MGKTILKAIEESIFSETKVGFNSNLELKVVLELGSKLSNKQYTQGNAEKQLN